MWWHPPVELSTAEQAIVRRVRRAKLFAFLRGVAPSAVRRYLPAGVGHGALPGPREGPAPHPAGTTSLGDAAASIHGGLRRRSDRGDHDGAALATRPRLPGLPG